MAGRATSWLRKRRRKAGQRAVDFAPDRRGWSDAPLPVRSKQVRGVDEATDFGGSSTVPGHPTTLNWFDLRKRW
jgi:hypothetical protein